MAEGRRQSAPAEAETGVIVVATEKIEGDAAQAVADRVRRHGADGGPRVHLVAPILARSALKQTLGDIDDEVEPARERLQASLDALREAGVEATGEVGDSDPVTAISDELQKHAADRILVVSHAREEDRAHAEEDLLERIDREFEQPATELLVERTGGNERVTDTETAPPGARRDEEGHRGSENLPPFRKQDLIGIVVAILGTIVLIVLAASCPDKNEEQGGPLMTIAGGCAIRYLLAGGFFLINLGHTGALLLMESVGYRGPFERFFARLSLIGTPIAIVVSALVS
jgi:hypothetical protein